MHAWRPHVKNDKARFCPGPRECQRGGPRGIVVGPTWNVTVFGRGAIPLVTNGATEEKRLCFAQVFGGFHVSNMPTLEKGTIKITDNR